jgi:hypothetical protein
MLSEKVVSEDAYESNNGVKALRFKIPHLPFWLDLGGILVVLGVNAAITLRPIRRQEGILYHLSSSARILFLGTSACAKINCHSAAACPDAQYNIPLKRMSMRFSKTYQISQAASVAIRAFRCGTSFQKSILQYFDSHRFHIQQLKNPVPATTISIMTPRSPTFRLERSLFRMSSPGEDLVLDLPSQKGDPPAQGVGGFPFGVWKVPQGV